MLKLFILNTIGLIVVVGLFSGCSESSTSTSSHNNVEYKQSEQGKSNAVRQVSMSTLLSIGEEVYNSQCVQCHLKEGQGVNGVIPSLVDSNGVKGDERQLIKIVYGGLSENAKLNRIMPTFPHLSNEEISAVLTYVRNSFGNQYERILPHEVQSITGKNDVKIMGRKQKNKKYKHFEEGFIDLTKINTPKGFNIDIFAKVHDARSLHVSPAGTVYVSNSKYGNSIYALRDENGDGKAEKKYRIAEGLARPNGIAFYKGDLYVSEIIRIIKFKDIENNLENPPKPEIVYDQFPNQIRHAPKYIRFGPDGKLYIPVGADCNVCEGEYEINATIVRMNPDGTDFEIFARGVRNSVGFDWHPETDEFWFTDNGRDWMGDDIPPCEINHAPESGMHFGFPYFHGGDIADPEFVTDRSADDFISPKYKTIAHVAPLGLRFYTGDMFPEEYKNAFFVSEHGSWNRKKKAGYRVMVGKINNNEVISYEPFLDGWLDSELNDKWGRPVDVQPLADGSILVSDDWADVIYRVTYEEK